MEQVPQNINNPNDNPNSSRGPQKIPTPTNNGQLSIKAFDSGPIPGSLKGKSLSAINTLQANLGKNKDEGPEEDSRPVEDFGDFFFNMEDPGDIPPKISRPQKSRSDKKVISEEKIPAPVETNMPVSQFTNMVVMMPPTEDKKEQMDTGFKNENIKINSSLSPLSYPNPRLKKYADPIIAHSENDVVLFFFINKLNGEGSGQKILDMGVKKVEFSDDMHCIAYIYDMKNDVQCANGIDTLKAELSRLSLVKVIIGAGDGAILEFIEQLLDSQVDINRCIFGVFPLGRRNDLSRELGWGSRMDISSDMAKFKIIVRDLAESTSVLIDIWEIKLACDPNDGYILQLNAEDTKVQMRDSNQNRITTFRKPFITYVSTGFDARVGFGFDKKRTSSRCCLTCLFCWEGCKKCTCRKTLPVNGFIEAFYVVKLNEDIIDSNDTNTQNETMKENEAPKDLVFQTVNQDGTLTIKQTAQEANRNREGRINTNRNIEGLVKFGNKQYQPIVLKGNPMGFVCQNIKYFIGGPSNTWKESDDHFGIETFDPDLNKEDKKAVEMKIMRDKETFHDTFKNSMQNLNDQKLEFFSYSSTWKLGCCKVTSGNTEKVFQGYGPYIITFKDTPTRTELDKFNRVYLNIDGEYYNIVKPREMRIRLAKKINGGKLKFIQKL